MIVNKDYISGLQTKEISNVVVEYTKWKKDVQKNEQAWRVGMIF